MIGALAAFSLVASDMPLAVAGPLALIVAGWGGTLTWREARRPGFVLVLPDADTALVDGEPVSGLHVDWRGALAFVRWTDASGRTYRTVWWPDTLPRAVRRELRLAVPGQTVPRASL